MDGAFGILPAGHQHCLAQRREADVLEAVVDSEQEQIIVEGDIHLLLDDVHGHFYCLGDLLADGRLDFAGAVCALNAGHLDGVYFKRHRLQIQIITRNNNAPATA